MSFASQSAQIPSFGAGTVQAFTGTSTSAVDLSASVGYEVLFTPSQTCHIRFGASDVGAATTNDFPLWANQTVKLRIENGFTHFRVIQNSANGNLHYVALIGA